MWVQNIVENAYPICGKETILAAIEPHPAHPEIGGHRSASHRGHGHFASGGYGYGNDCSWLRRYSWARYEACIGVY